MIDPGVVLALIADLQAEILALRQRIAEQSQPQQPPTGPRVVPREDA